LAAWLNGQPHTEPFTFVVDLAGHLRLAPRRSEHVALSAGQDVLAAGEMAFDRHGNVSMVSNQSTGYCPDPGCWPAVGRTLDALGIAHPGRFTHEIVFSRCTECGQRNIVRDNDFTCAVCDSPLPNQRR